MLLLTRAVADAHLGGTREGIRSCNALLSSSDYSALPLASPKPGAFNSLPPSLDAIKANPGNYYVNVHTVESERIAPDKGSIRGQLSRA